MKRFLAYYRNMTGRRFMQSADFFLIAFGAFLAVGFVEVSRASYVAEHAAAHPAVEMVRSYIAGDWVLEAAFASPKNIFREGILSCEDRLQNALTAYEEIKPAQ